MKSEPEEVEILKATSLELNEDKYLFSKKDFEWDYPCKAYLNGVGMGRDNKSNTRGRRGRLSPSSCIWQLGCQVAIILLGAQLCC